jgi:hypothetical protein
MQRSNLNNSNSNWFKSKISTWIVNKDTFCTQVVWSTFFSMKNNIFEENHTNQTRVELLMSELSVTFALLNRRSKNILRVTIWKKLAQNWSSTKQYIINCHNQPTKCNRPEYSSLSTRYKGHENNGAVLAKPGTCRPGLMVSRLHKELLQDWNAEVNHDYYIQHQMAAFRGHTSYLLSDSTIRTSWCSECAMIG